MTEIIIRLAILALAIFPSIAIATMPLWAH